MTEELLDDSIGFHESEQDSDQKNNPDLASIASQLDSNETLSFGGSEYDFCEELQQAENDDDSVPLFLHFTCTVKSGIQYENISVKKLVPCIGKLRDLKNNLKTSSCLAHCDFGWNII